MLKTLYIDSAGKEGVMQPVAESIKYLTTSSHSRTANINSMVGEIGQHIQDRLTDAIAVGGANGSAKKSKKKSPKKSADDASAYPQAGEVDLDKEFSLKVVLKQLSTLYKTMDIEEYVDIDNMLELLYTAVYRRTTADVVAEASVDELEAMHEVLTEAVQAGLTSCTWSALEVFKVSQE
jgi:hypothetical protein